MTKESGASTFSGTGLYCDNCSGEMRDHLGEALACPQAMSQPLSRVVAGPVRAPVVGDRVRRVEDGVEGEVVWIGRDCVARAQAVEVRRSPSPSTSIMTPLEGFAERWIWVEEEGCGGPREACARPGCEECGGAHQFIDTIAALRALTPKQRSALLAIGADGPALLEAARRTVAFDGRASHVDRLAEVLRSIDARR